MSDTRLAGRGFSRKFPKNSMASQESLKVFAVVRPMWPQFRPLHHGHLLATKAETHGSWSRVEFARVWEASLLWSVIILEVRADSGFYRVLLKVLVCEQLLAVRGTLYSWPCCTLGFGYVYIWVFGYGKAMFVLVSRGPRILASGSSELRHPIMRELSISEQPIPEQSVPG